MPIGAFKLNTISAAQSSAAEEYFLIYNSSTARANEITPGGFDVDTLGNMYIFDMYSGKYAKITPTGSIAWQKNFTTSPSSKGDGGLLSVDEAGTYMYFQIKENLTSIALCQVSCSDGSLVSKTHCNVAASGTYGVAVGNTVVATGGTSIYMNFGATVNGTSRMIVKRYNLSSGLLPASAAATTYEFATGSTPVIDSTRMCYNSNGSTVPFVIYYPNIITRYNTTPARSTTYAITGLDSIANYGTNTYLVKDNTITKYSNLIMTTKAWEKTHTVSSVGGSLYYNQGIALDSTENIYACYWNSTSNKLIIYKLDASGNLQWTKSLYPNGATGLDGPTLKVVGSKLYIAFRYGTISSGGIGILKIPTDGTLTKTFSNGFVLANETGSVASTSTLTVSAASGLVNTSVVISNSANSQSVTDISLTSLTKTVI